MLLLQAAFFDREDQALGGFENLFLDLSKEKSDRAEALIAYQNERGGRVVFQDISKPNLLTAGGEWASVPNAASAALELEKTLNSDMLSLHRKVEEHGDPHFSDFLESRFLNVQVESMKKWSDWLTKLKRAGNGVGLHLIDKEVVMSNN
jgi:ferritin heavy chain